MQYVKIIAAYILGVVIGLLILPLFQERPDDEPPVMSKTVVKADALIAELRGENDRLKNKIDLLKRKYEGEIADINVEFRKKDEEINRLKKKLEKRQAEAEAKNAETAELPKTAEGLETKIADLLADIENSPSDRGLVKKLVEMHGKIKDKELSKQTAERLIAILEKELKNDTENVDLLYNCSMGYLAEIQRLQPLLGGDPARYGTKMMLASNKGIALLDRAHKLKPEDNEILLTRAIWCMHSPGSMDRAEKDFSVLAERADKNRLDEEIGVQVFLGLAELHVRKEQPTKAKAALEQGAALYPSNQALDQALGKLNTVKEDDR